MPLFFTLLARKPRPHHEHPPLQAHGAVPLALGPQVDPKGSVS